jgi:hypothetical protein
MFVRYQAAEPSPRGSHPGIFALANHLAREGHLTSDEYAWWRTNNDWYDAAYQDPGKVEPSIFDRTIHPITSCWFKVTAEHLLARIPGYLRLLDAHGVRWAEVRSDDPGHVIYEDDVQVVVVR